MSNDLDKNEKLLIYTDPRFLDHKTGPHPESPARLQRIAAMLDEQGWRDRAQFPTWQPASAAELALVHDERYIPRVEQYAAAGGGRLEVDTQVSPDSFAVASLAAGAAIDAVRQVLAGNGRRAFCALRPPGHHALYDRPMGFCLFNNIAIAARYAIEKMGVDKVLIVDWDVHHGNGTQDAFWQSDQVGFLSSHRYPFYPGTGAADETGAGSGLGWTVNVPVAFGTSRQEFRDRLTSAVERFADKLRPDLVLLSAGFDAHRLDPVGSLGLESDDFRWLTRLVVDVADRTAAGRVVSLLEGGYNVEVLPDCVDYHLNALL